MKFVWMLAGAVLLVGLIFGVIYGLGGLLQTVLSTGPEAAEPISKPRLAAYILLTVASGSGLVIAMLAIKLKTTRRELTTLKRAWERKSAFMEEYLTPRAFYDGQKLRAMRIQTSIEREHGLRSAFVDVPASLESVREFAGTIAESRAKTEELLGEFTGRQNQGLEYGYTVHNSWQDYLTKRPPEPEKEAAPGPYSGSCGPRRDANEKPDDDQFGGDWRGSGSVTDHVGAKASEQD